MNCSAKRGCDMRKIGPGRATLSVVLPLALALAVWLPAVLPDEPWTFRGRFDRIRPGMARGAVRAALGPPSIAPAQWLDRPTHAVVWTAGADGAERQEYG